MHPDRRAEEQFRLLYDRYARHVYRFFLRRVEEEATAQDCTADTFLVAWRRFKDVPEGDRALAWLYGVSRRVLANHYRSNTRSKKLFLRLGWLRENDGPIPEGIVVRRSQDREVIEALHRLRPDDQELLRLTFWEELPNAEIGELLGCSAHAAAQRRHRAANRLARQLDLSGHKEEKPATPRPAPRGETR